MKICILNGSPRGIYSITSMTSCYLEKCFPQHSFTYVLAAAQIRSLEKDLSPALKAMEEADLIIFSYPVYTFLAPSQLHRFIRLLKESGADLSGKFVTQITTSKHFYDVTAHRYVEDNCFDLGMRVIHGLSADMDDLTTKKGQEDAVSFFRYVLWCVENGISEKAPLTAAQPAASSEKPISEDVNEDNHACSSKDECGVSSQYSDENHNKDNNQYNNEDSKESNKKEASIESSRDGNKSCAVDNSAVGAGKSIAIVADLRKDDNALRARIEAFRQACPLPTRLINLAEYPFQGGCLGCFHCAASGKCVYTDGFDAFLREQIQTNAAIVYAFTIQDHSMGPTFKMYDDRQFCNGHRTVTEGMPFGYIVCGDYEREPNLRTVIEARCEVGHNFLAGVGTDSSSDQVMLSRLRYALEHQYLQPRNFYGVGGMKIFRDLIWVMQGFMKADHEFYKKHGIYDFPQKQCGRMLMMQLVGFMMRHTKLMEKQSNAMNEGMMAPYKKAIDSAKPQ